MIVDVDNINLIDSVIKNSGDIVGLDRTALKKMLFGCMFNDDKFVMADIDNGEMRAFMFATIEVLDGEDVCFIQACSSDKLGSVDVILLKLMDWCKQLGLTRMVFMTKRNPLAWQRKYNFNQIYSVMERKI